jgi:acetyl-CoA synthetase
LLTPPCSHAPHPTPLRSHVKAGYGDRTCFFWEGNEPADAAAMTYSEVLAEVCRMANYLRSVGVKKGDAVSIYMPMVCELPIAMLACARIGAVHSVVFGGFSAEALAQRIADCKAKVLITASGVMRGAKRIDLKAIADKGVDMAAKEGHAVPTVVVHEVKHAQPRADTAFAPGRDVWWEDAVKGQAAEAEVEWVEADHPLFLLYTSGSTGALFACMHAVAHGGREGKGCTAKVWHASFDLLPLCIHTPPSKTGKPKGVVHSTGGYMVYTWATSKYVFNMAPGDVYWCTADCGWITGHSYLTYGPMLVGATQVVFEGVPTYPGPDRCWAIVDKYNVKQFYTAPTAIRSLMRAGELYVKEHGRDSLRILGSVGEPINPEVRLRLFVVVLQMKGLDRLSRVEVQL